MGSMWHRRLSPLYYMLGGSAVVGGAGLATFTYITAYDKIPKPADGSDASADRSACVFDALAKQYDAVVGQEEFGMGYGLMRWLLMSYVKGDVLEISAGTGRNLKHYPLHNINSLTLCDISKPMLERAEDKYFDELHLGDRHHGTHIRFCLSDAHCLVAAAEDPPEQVALTPGSAADIAAAALRRQRRQQAQAQALAAHQAGQEAVEAVHSGGSGGTAEGSRTNVENDDEGGQFWRIFKPASKLQRYGNGEGGMGSTNQQTTKSQATAPTAASQQASSSSSSSSSSSTSTVPPSTTGARGAAPPTAPSKPSIANQADARLPVAVKASAPSRVIGGDGISSTTLSSSAVETCAVGEDGREDVPRPRKRLQELPGSGSLLNIFRILVPRDSSEAAAAKRQQQQQQQQQQLEEGHPPAHDASKPESNHAAALSPLPDAPSTASPPSPPPPPASKRTPTTPQPARHDAQQTGTASSQGAGSCCCSSRSSSSSSSNSREGGAGLSEAEGSYVARCRSGRMADGARLTRFLPHSFDTVVDTFGLCSHEDPVQVLREAALLLKPGGRIILLEHGRASYGWLNRRLDDSAAAHHAKWGCWWNRDILDLIAQADLKVNSSMRWHFGTSYLVIVKPMDAE